MEKHFREAVNWAKDQYIVSLGIKIYATEESFVMVDKVREYFNENNIEYESFDFNTLKPFLDELGVYYN